jgi:hypothetical protein
MTQAVEFHYLPTRHGKRMSFTNPTLPSALVVDDTAWNTWSRILHTFFEYTARPQYFHPPKAYRYRAPLAEGQSCAFGSPRFCPWTSGDNGYKDERIVGGARLALEDAIADLTAMTPSTTSAWLEHHTMMRHRKVCQRKVSAYKYHTVSSQLCQRRVFHIESDMHAGRLMRDVRGSFPRMADHMMSAQPFRIQILRKGTYFLL